MSTGLHIVSNEVKCAQHHSQHGWAQCDDGMTKQWGDDGMIGERVLQQSKHGECCVNGVEHEWLAQRGMVCPL